MNNLSLPSSEDIARRLEQEESIVIAPNFYAYRWPGSIELKQGAGEEQIIVERGFGELNEADQILWNEWNARVRKYLETYTLPTLEDAVRIGVSRLLELRKQGVKNYIDARLW